MFSLFSTIPVEHSQKQFKGQRRGISSRRRTVLTWCLLVIWLILISFAAVSTLNPEWLQELSRLGIEAESRDYKNFGDDLLSQGNYRLALAQYQRAIEIKPDYADAMVNMAIAYGRAGDEARAIHLLERALHSEDSDDGVVYYTLAEISEKQNKIDEAIRYCQKALDSGAEEHMIYRKLGTLYFTAKEYEKAREAFKNSLAGQTDLCFSYKRMLNASLSDYKDDSTHLPIIEDELAGDIDPADLAAYDLEIIRRVQQSDPEIAKTHNHLGVIYAIQGDITQATEHFQKSLEIWPGNTDALKNLKILRRRPGSDSPASGSVQ